MRQTAKNRGAILTLSNNAGKKIIALFPLKGFCKGLAMQGNYPSVNTHLLSFEEGFRYA